MVSLIVNILTNFSYSLMVPKPSEQFRLCLYSYKKNNNKEQVQVPALILFHLEIESIKITFSLITWVSWRSIIEIKIKRGKARETVSLTIARIWYSIMQYTGWMQEPREGCCRATILQLPCQERSHKFSCYFPNKIMAFLTFWSIM